MMAAAAPTLSIMGAAQHSAAHRQNIMSVKRYSHILKLKLRSENADLCVNINRISRLPLLRVHYLLLMGTDNKSHWYKKREADIELNLFSHILLLYLANKCHKPQGNWLILFTGFI